MCDYGGGMRSSWRLFWLFCVLSLLLAAALGAGCLPTSAHAEPDEPLELGELKRLAIVWSAPEDFRGTYRVYQAGDMAGSRVEMLRDIHYSKRQAEWDQYVAAGECYSWWLQSVEGGVEGMPSNHISYCADDVYPNKPVRPPPVVDVTVTVDVAVAGEANVDVIVDDDER